MLVVALTHAGDIADLRRLIEWMRLLDGKLNHDALIVCDAGAPFRDAMELRDEVRQLFRTVKFTTNGTPVKGWPDGCYSLFKTAVRYVAEKWPQPFLIVEPDCVPLCKGWLDRIANDYEHSGTPSLKTFFFGHIYKCDQQGMPPLLMSGIAVYPPDTNARLPLHEYPVHWDVDGAAVMVSQGLHTPLIHHFFGLKDFPPTFVEAKKPEHPINAVTLDWIPKGAVLFHRNKDGTLIQLLAKRLGIEIAPEPEDKYADVVSLRRNGDIISILPLLRKMSLKEGRPIKLVVNRDFMPLLDGVSYVKGVPWDGEWENPLAAASKFQARNAQVYGQGKVLGTGTGDFVKQAWELLGHRWNRYLPMVFDKRDPEREKELAAKTFKTDKPKILVKLEGHSSPFGERQEIWKRLQHFAPVAELVLLDNLMADRVYDLIGLIDRAACLITADTCTLHLAHASQCPVIAFVNGDGFHASPPRGNTIFRAPYGQVISRWMEIVRRIESALTPDSTGADAVLVFSAFTPRDPDTKRRQDAAYLTWPRLNARLFPFVGTRNSVSIGDSRGMPFMRDMIEAGFASGPESILAILNNDIKVDERLGEAILASCARHGCYWAYRLDRPGGRTDQGADCFAFTRKWWTVHRHLMPDFLLGYWNWDDALVRIMRWSGCDEQERLYYHEPHPGTQSPTRLQTPGQHYNNRLWEQWLAEHQEPRHKPHV